MNALEKFIGQTAEKMILGIFENYDLGQAFVPIVKVCHKKSTTRCIGGLNDDWTPFIRISANDVIGAAANKNKIDYSEYPSISSDPVIGRIIKRPWRALVATLVAHELSHALQFFARDVDETLKTFIGANSDYSAHGQVWKDIYGFLRTNYVNHTEFRPGRLLTELNRS